MLGGPNDKNNAILNINVGAGGVDSQDFAEMLRMYTRYAESRGYRVENVEYQPGEGLVSSQPRSLFLVNMHMVILKQKSVYTAWFVFPLLMHKHGDTSLPQCGCYRKFLTILILK